MLAVQAGATGGTIEGKVTFTGKPRRSPLIQMGADPNCLTINAGRKTVQQDLVVSRDGSVANVFLHIVDDIPYGGPPPAEPVTIEQEGCIYHPRVSGAMIGQYLNVRNNDNTLHNIRAQSEANFFNVGQPFSGLEFDFKLKKAEVMLQLKCDVHDWMLGYIGVKSHPYFAVSGKDGTFRIEGVPVGRYTLQAWGETLGAQDREIEVKEGETVTVDFVFPPE